MRVHSPPCAGGAIEDPVANETRREFDEALELSLSERRYVRLSDPRSLTAPSSHHIRPDVWQLPLCPREGFMLHSFFYSWRDDCGFHAHTSELPDWAVGGVDIEELRESVALLCME